MCSVVCCSVSLCWSFLFAHASRDFQKHYLNLPLQTEVRIETRKVPAGTFVIKSSQKLGSLAAYLLEPRAEDGLTTWNYFDEGIAEGQDHPVLRVMGATGK